MCTTHINNLLKIFIYGLRIFSHINTHVFTNITFGLPIVLGGEFEPPWISAGPTQNIYYVTPNFFPPLNLVKIAIYFLATYIYFLILLYRSSSIQI